MREVTDHTFDDEVLRAAKPVVVDFWAPWCGPCRAVAPVLERLAEETEGVDFVTVNIDDNPRVAARFDVLSIPTVMLFERGAPAETIVGARPERHFRRALARFL